MGGCLNTTIPAYGSEMTVAIIRFRTRTKRDKWRGAIAWALEGSGLSRI